MDASREIEAWVRDALVRFGVMGDVTVHGTSIELRGVAVPSALDIAQLLADWPDLSPQHRQRRAHELAQLFASEQRAAPATAQLGGAGAGTAARSPQEVGGPPGRIDEASTAAASANEIEQAVRVALGRFGVSGGVVVRENQVELHGRGSTVAIDLDVLVAQWALLPAEMRDRKVAELVKRLVAALRAGGTEVASPGAGLLARKMMWIPGAAVVIVLLAAAWVVGSKALRGALSGGEAAVADAGAPAENPEQAKARQARVCDAARKRLYAGASIGPFDTEGWYAELWLARASAETNLAAHPAVRGLLAEGDRLALAADEELGALPEGKVEIVDGFGPKEAAASPAWRSTIVRFSGRYMGAFLDPQMRPRFNALADRVAAGASADLAALYGRCAHLAYHDLGAWFRGKDAPAAAVALVYGMGFFAELASVDRGAVTALGGAGELDALRIAAGKLDVPAVASLVGQQGGSVTSPQGAVTITFPTGGGTRATSASRQVARRLGVGVKGD